MVSFYYIVVITIIFFKTGSYIQEFRNFGLEKDHKTVLQIQIEHAPEKVQKFNILYVPCSYKDFLCDIRCRIPAIRNRTIEIEYLDDEDVWVGLFSDACVGEVLRCTKPIFGSKKGV